MDFLRQYGHSMFPIGNGRKRSSDEMNRQLQDTRIQLALARQREHDVEEKHDMEKQLLAQEHELEVQRLRIQFQQQQLDFVLRFQQQQQQQQPVQSTATTTTMSTTRNRTVTMNDWLYGKFYQQQQDVSRLSLVNATRWSNLFDNPALHAEQLLANTIVHGSLASRSVRLALPLTFRYRLRKVLSLLLQQQGSEAKAVQQIIDACPHDYTVILYGGVNVSPLKHRINCTILALHCHLVMSVERMKTDTVRKQSRFSPILHEATVPAYRQPSLDLMARHYPSSVYFGPGTYLTQDFTIPLKQHRPIGSVAEGEEDDDDEEDGEVTERQKKKQKTAESGTKGIGTGHNKCCPYCCFPARTLSQGDVYKKSHHPINCPAIALASENEAEVLGHIRARCLQSVQSPPGKKKKRIAAHTFIVGKQTTEKSGASLDSIVFQCGDNTVTRLATPEELDRGEHYYGLRLNRQRFTTMCRDVRETLKTQLEGALFGELHPVARRLMECFADMERDPVPPLRSLLYDEFGEKFMATRFPVESKKVPRVPVPEFAPSLYFSLDSSLNRPQTVVTANGVQQTALDFYVAEYQAECLQQHCYLAPMLGF
jgi:hypothetical protein